MLNNVVQVWPVLGVILGHHSILEFEGFDVSIACSLW